jgi:hypothetical protein
LGFGAPHLDFLALVGYRGVTLRRGSINLAFALMPSLFITALIRLVLRRA